MSRKEEILENLRVAIEDKTGVDMNKVADEEALKLLEEEALKCPYCGSHQINQVRNVRYYGCGCTLDWNLRNRCCHLMFDCLNEQGYRQDCYCLVADHHMKLESAN